ncbi:SR protein-specific kinase Dsk1 [Penicillium waksmanii]|uniref:SR protein-specific kinase Dsk1 n=1 Tax=Penicillium waksmanii TaxID=69791 RepID=UPI0025490150|nr:SR protein-specific kinase Dsk1 [Penicillium waksmanii]KAJ5966439.1 SR protein-specific kinase Dsk1 [Penicillium waksmanii]
MKWTTQKLWDVLYYITDTLADSLYPSASPEDLFNEPITQPTAADIWTLGINLYEVLGERPLFETFSWDRDNIFPEITKTLGQPPARWLDSRDKCSEFFKEDRSWVADFRRISVFRRLRQRLWEIGRGETEQTCEWDVAGGELNTLEDLLRAMVAFEPGDRSTAKTLLIIIRDIRYFMNGWALWGG